MVQTLAAALPGHFWQSRLPSDNHDNFNRHDAGALVALDADTGNVVWERRVNDFHSDVRRPRRPVSPAVDPATGIIYMFTGAAELLAFAPDGKVLWDRSLPEETARSQRTAGATSPIVEGDKVILNTHSELGSRSWPSWQSLLRFRQTHAVRQSG